jgi:hypothetical protein
MQSETKYVSSFQSLNQNENIVSFITMPPMMKPFSPGKARDRPYSTNPVTARTREICQSRSGWGAERARIMTKYRTRQARANAALRKSSQWARLSEKERAEAQKSVVDEIESKRDAELQATAKEWVKLAYGQETMNVSEQEDVDGKSELLANSDIEEWTGIPDDDEDKNHT